MKLQIAPVFQGKNTVPVVFSSNQKFVPVLAVMVQSVIEHASENYNYDLIILTQDIDSTYEERLQSMVKDAANIQLRVVNVKEYFEDYTLYTENRESITVETYFRLVIPQLMPDYDKVLYLDGDMVANADLAELFETDLGNCLVGASADCDSIGVCHMGNPALEEYRRDVLKLKYPDRYFCAGMLVMNLKRFREKFDAEELLKLAASYNWRQHDQDVLNMVCNEEVKLISIAWDLLRDAGHNRYMPKEMYEDFLQAEAEPKIIHYGGMRKPWIYFDVERGEYFWRYAGKTPFFREILSMVSDANAERVPIFANGQLWGGGDLKEIVLKQFADGEIGLRYVKKYFSAWLGFKLRGRAQ